MTLDAPVPNAPNFTLREFVRTTHRDLLETNAQLPAELVPAAVATLQLLQTVRGHYARPVVLHSGYRSPRLNLRVGGSPTSQHQRAQAADFHVVGKTCEEVWEWIVNESGIAFGQCLLEGYQAGRPSWVHLSLGRPHYEPTHGRQVGRSEDGGRTFTWFR